MNSTNPSMSHRTGDPNAVRPAVAAHDPIEAEGFDLARFRDAVAVVILPTLNEEQGLARTLQDLPFDRFELSGRKIQPLVIDGGSTDATLEVARTWNIPVLQQTSRGKGGAMLEAIAWVHRMGIPYAVVLDADATYPPDRILPALDLLQAGTDLVIGVRHPVWGPPKDLKDLVHRIGNLAMSYSASILTRRPILDLCSGFWGVSTDRFMGLHLDNSSFAIEAELVLKSVRQGLSIHQIAIDYHERVGQAKLRALRDGSRIFLTILREAGRPSRPDLSHHVPTPWIRDVLSIGLSIGTSGALLECEPSEAPEARRIARYLRQSLPDTRVEISAYPSSPTPFRRPRRPAPTGHPLVVALPSVLGISGGLRTATVSIRSESREMQIDLSRAPPVVGPVPAPSAWARSGGTRRDPRTWPSGSASLLVLTSRLNFARDHQQATLLTANGFRVVEQVFTRSPPSGTP